MTKEEFLQQVQDHPETIQFADTMAVIEQYYDFTETEFNNAGLNNKPGQNSGSCKLFAFAQLHYLNKEQTLACFGAYYREDVLKHPDGQDHQNIRNFINNGWSGIAFTDSPLKEKAGSQLDA